MAQWSQCAWLPLALLLFGLTGCVSLSGPNEVMGTVGGSLQVLCHYEEKYRDHLKYWCKSPCLIGWKKIVATTASEKNVRSGRVSIRDEPATLTVTVTWKNLTQEDAGTYGCGIDRPLSLTESWIDVIHEVIVTVSPASASTSSPTSDTATKTSVPTTIISTVLSTVLTTESTTYIASNLKEPLPKMGLQVLLPLLALLLLLLGLSSLLAWWMVRKQAKVGKNPVQPQNYSQSEPCYENLELQTRSLHGKSVPFQQAEVVYSTVVSPREDVHYTTVVFDPQNQDYEADRSPPQSRVEQQPVYSVVKKR